MARLTRRDALKLGACGVGAMAIEGCGIGLTLDEFLQRSFRQMSPEEIGEAIARLGSKHPELVVTFMKGMINVGFWANAHKRAAAAILDKQTFYLDVDDTYEGIKHIDMVPNLSPQNLVSAEIGKDFMLSHGYIKNDFDVQKWAAPEFHEQAAQELIDEEFTKRKAERLSIDSGANRIG